MKSFTETYSIHSYEVDTSRKLSFPSLANFLQESASNHAHALHCGYNQLKENNKFWVLSRLLIRMKNAPQWGETISLRTWPKGFDGLLALRDFSICNEAQQEVATASSAWLIIDGTSRRIQKVQELFPLDAILEEHAIAEPLKKLPAIEGKEITAKVQAVYSNIDMLNHVNNVSYLRWAIDHLPVDKMKMHINEVELNFISEAAFDSVCSLVYQKMDEHNYVCAIFNEDCTQEHVRCRVQLTMEN